ncbi:MAG: bifunctional 5,10-methylene-tetrahydrofolate dehydrogenase/5,10-methylene-tetrahydrofolate cyclohydrolase [Spirochaetota bacterium]|nr:MAG: bifunctional 5,10-methylene-tetrahydrofolate dehydrogenase/5,10-methylene-tetrahydrofolate cyclohydrolase [Spirochaetota bacterium]
MSAKVIDCVAIAEEIKKELMSDIEGLKKKGISVGIATVLVGDDFGARMYRGQIEKFCQEMGVEYTNANPSSDASEADVVKVVEELNENDKVSGIIPLRPFPEHISDYAIINTIELNKDIDCFHPYNMGKLTLGEITFAPATPAACIEIMDREKVNFEGAEIVVVGHSNIVGKPISILCLNRNATTSTTHIFTSMAKNLEKHTTGADILIVAAGKANLITPAQVKEGAFVIDVGINRVKVLDENGEPVLNEKGKPKTKTVGDVDFDAVKEKAGKITPVPGGVGAITNMMLMRNTVKAAKVQHGLE